MYPKKQATRAKVGATAIRFASAANSFCHFIAIAQFFSSFHKGRIVNSNNDSLHTEQGRGRKSTLSQLLGFLLNRKGVESLSGIRKCTPFFIRNFPPEKSEGLGGQRKLGVVRCFHSCCIYYQKHDRATLYTSWTMPGGRMIPPTAEQESGGAGSGWDVTSDENTTTAPSAPTPLHPPSFGSSPSAEDTTSEIDMASSEVRFLGAGR